MKPRQLIQPIWALLLLGLLDVGLFAPFLTGSRWFLGNADRFNTYLTVLHATGELKAGWDPTIFGGWNISAMPWFFPVGYESLLMGASLGDFLHRTAWLSFGFFLASGLSAWMFLREVFRSPWLAVVGAILYQCAFCSVLRITQNDQTFGALALAPFLLWAARRAVVARSNPALGLLALGGALLVWFTFLQEAAYVALLLAAYLVFLTVSHQGWRRGLITALCAGAGLAAGLPRMWLAGKELGLVVRQGGARPFDELFEYQNIRPWEFLRFFDDTVFGRNHAEAGLSNLNFSEGFQLFIAQLAPFLVLWLLVSRNGRSAGPLPSREKWFHLGAFVTTAAVVCLKPAYHAVYLLFGRVDFYHTRIIVAGLLPLVVLVVAALERMMVGNADDQSSAPLRSIVAVGAGVAAGAVLSGLASLCAPETGFWRLPVGAWHWLPDVNRVVHVYQPAVAAILLGGLGALGLALVLRRTRWSRDAVMALAAVAATQAVLAARYQLQGPHTRGRVPFELGNSWQPDRDDFHVPTSAELAELHRRLGAPDHRAAVVSKDPRSYGLLANSVGRFHGLELIDGYGNGVPRNLAWLPWGKDALRLRQIHFSSSEGLPWRTLALAGIEHVWMVDRRVFTSDPARFAPATFLANPVPALPRVFFPQRVIAAPTTAECQAWMMALPDAPRLDAEQITIVRAHAAPAAGGVPAELRRISTAPDAIDLDVAPAAHDRFVVVNTRWHPGWWVETGGRAVAAYEANGFMLGAIIPAGASSVRFQFHPIRWAFVPAPALP